MTDTAVPSSPLRVDVLLRSGSLAEVRQLSPDDREALSDLNARVSLRTRTRRYFSLSDRPGQWYVEQLMLTARDQQALVALVQGHVVGLASFTRLARDPQAADLAVLIDDEHQHEGLGALLLEHLAHAARGQGIRRFTADVLLENTPMLRLLADSGFATHTNDVGAGVCELSVDLDDSPRLRTALHRREADAERASLAHVLAPRSVAVVGSAKTDSVAGRVCASLRGRSAQTPRGFAGPVHAVTERHGLLALAAPVDLVVVAVPAAQVLEVASEAAAAGAQGLLVLSADFAESGDAGRLRQRELLALCRAKGLRLVGPNCLGIVNTDPAVRLNATFCDAQPLSGGIGLISQSGAVGIAALRHAERRGAGLSIFVSTGNKADVSGNDLLCYLEQDAHTSVIALYLESFGNARRFVRVASAVGLTKPIVVVKSGRSEAGVRAGQSHTAAAASPDAAVDAMLRAAGVIRAEDLPAMFDVLSLLDAAPLPTGHRVAIIGNSGGPGVLAADACATSGLQVAELSDQTRSGLAELVPSMGSPTNPVDLLATVDVSTFEAALTLVLKDPGVDAVVTIYTPMVRGSEEDFARAVRRAHAAVPDQTLVATFPGLAWPPSALQEGDGAAVVPSFEFPEPALRALGLVAGHAAWRRNAIAPDATVVPARPPARGLLAATPDGEWLSSGQVAAMLEAYDIPVVPVREVHDNSAAFEAAKQLGVPVALKAYGPSLVHKSDGGGVLLGLDNPEAVRRAYDDMAARLGPAMVGALVQRMHLSDGGLELLLGLTVDPEVGPLVLVAAGGIYTDLLQDRALRLPTTSLTEAIDQISSLRCAKRFGGFRGQPPLDLDATARVVLALGAIARDLPEVLELDINPLLVTHDGVNCLDARVRIGTPHPWPGLTTRSLSPS